MLLPLLAVPVIILVALTHSLIQAYAPSNVLVRHVRASRPGLRTVVALGALAFGCALAGHTIHVAVEVGAPDWLNLIVLVLCWDAIKFAVMALLTSVRCAANAGGTRISRGSAVLPVVRRSL